MKDDRLERAAAGDPSALRRLLQDWWPQARVWARRALHDPDLADEAVQEAMLNVTRFIGRVDPTRPFGAWLHRVVVNAARDVGRLHRRHTHTELPEVPVHPNPDHHLDLKRAAERAVRAFDALPPRQRELVTRVDLRGETAAEVARDLGLTAGAVRNQLYTARRTLRTTMFAQNPFQEVE